MTLNALKNDEEGFLVTPLFCSDALDVSTKAKHVIWWSQERPSLAKVSDELDLDYNRSMPSTWADEDCLMKNLLEATWTRIVQVKTLYQHEDGWVIRSWSLVGFVCWWLS